MAINGHFSLNAVFAPVYLELCRVAFGAWLYLWRTSANFKPKQIAAQLPDFLGIAQHSFLVIAVMDLWSQ